MSNQNNYEEYFRQIVGYENVKNELCKIADILHDTEKYRTHGVNTPRGLLLYGEPGVGKTTMAECLIQASKREVFVCRKSSSEASFIRNIKACFDKAKDACPSIVFLDDMDKFSNDDEKHPNSDAFVTIQACIDSLKKKDVVVISTVNSISAIPRSLLREGRFDRRIKIENPTVKDAAVIIAHYLENKQCVKDIDTLQIARLMSGSSCAALETIVNEAGIHSVYSGKELIDLDDIVEACLEIFFHAPRSQEKKEDGLSTDYHEAGHVVAREVLTPSSVALVSTRISRGQDSGITVFSKDMSAVDLFSAKRLILTCLAGKAAVEVALGISDMGSGKDIDEACYIAKRVLSFSCSLGFDKYLSDIYDDYDESGRKEASVITLIELCYLEAIKLLSDNRDFLEDVAEALLQKETLLEADIAEIRNRHKIIPFTA